MRITKYDTIQQIVAGTFNCSLVNRDDSNDQIEITNGRFDFKWNTINEMVFP